MEKILSYEKNNITYEVIVSYRRIKNTYFRYRGGKFYISAPYFSSSRTLLKSLDRFYPKLTRIKNIEPPIGENYVYVFGKKVEAKQGKPTKSNYFIYKDEKDFEKRLKKVLLDYIVLRVLEYEKIMNIKNLYNVRVRQMKTRYGTNSKKTHTVAFALKLIHFDKRIIDAIIVHELAHYFYFDHSKGFYKVIDKYEPNYKSLHKALNEGKYNYD